MIHQIIHPRLHPFRRAEVHAIELADGLDLFPRTGQAYDRRVELDEVMFQDGGCVARWIAGDEDGEKGG